MVGDEIGSEDGYFTGAASFRHTRPGTLFLIKLKIKNENQGIRSQTRVRRGGSEQRNIGVVKITMGRSKSTA